MIEPIFQVKLTRGVDGELEGDPVVTYISPKAKDAENDKILMKFKGGTPFMELKQNGDDTFTVKITKAALPTKSDKYPISIGLEDDRGEKQIPDSRMIVEVEYIDNYVEVEEEPKEVEKKEAKTEPVKKEEAI